MTYLAGLGTALPPRAIDQAEAEAVARAYRPAGRDRAVRALWRRSGVRRRHSVVLDGPGGPAFYPPAAEAPAGPTTAERMRRYEVEAPRLAVGAAAAALADAGIDGAAITHLVTVSCTGFAAPGVDLALVEDLGLPAGVGRLHIGFMGCHGAMNALRAADAIATADAAARVLVCAVETCSLHLRYDAPADAEVANALFADGAAAAIVAGGSAPAGAWRIDGFESRIVAGTAEAMTWRIGDHGFEMTLSPRVPAIIRDQVAPWLICRLAARGLEPAGVGAWAVHPGGPRLLAAVEEGLGLPAGGLVDSRAILAEFGNMSSATILFLLDRLRRRGAPRPCVALALGPGLAAEAAVLA